MDTTTRVLPPWAEELRQKYLAGVANTFLIHFNVFDQVPYNGDYVPLKEFFYRFFDGKKEIVAFYNVSEGLTFATEEMRRRFFSLPGLRSEEYAAGLKPVPKQASVVLGLLETALKAPKASIAVVIDYLEAVAPAGQISFLSAEDRQNVTTLQRWASNQYLLEQSDTIVILIAAKLGDVHENLRSAPQIDLQQIPRPDHEERLAYLRYLVERQGATVSPEMPLERLAGLTAGLNRQNLYNIHKLARRESRAIDYELVRDTKKEILQDESAGLLEVVEPKHGLDSIGGLEYIKERLMKIARYMREGDTKRVPMALAFGGPPGTGKTAVAFAFAKESGVNCVILKEAREMWVGSSERNQEYVFRLIEAMAPVIVIVDEADQSEGSRGNHTDSEVDKRLWAQKIRFMGDPAHRGRIIFIFTSNRLDLIDVAMKRRGRIDQIIPFLYLEDKMRPMVFQTILKKQGIPFDVSDWQPIIEATDRFSGADIESIVLSADELAADEKAPAVTQKHLLAALGDFIQARNEEMIRYMELLALTECSARSMLPESLRETFDRNAALEELDQIRTKLKLEGVI
ncbi:MAG TPA: ATP-binding protein [Armatimonadetes bacterium]|jgi:transitional endoplasmic reticulum ATPase|nr:ATP-binding protein [Armatimonadota bacterium]